MTDNYVTQRTIEEVFDLETGEIINSKDFFEKPESEIIEHRRRLQEAINGYSKSKFVCIYCNQLVKLSGISTRRGLVSFFAHLHDSDDCEIKTDGNNLSKEQIEILKYSKIRESERHKYLKDRIYKCLTDESSALNGVKDVEVEKRIVSKLPYFNWRQPDISFEYGGKKIVLELQLSTTFLSVVVQRDIFYKMNEMFIIWVFNFSENQQYVNLGNLMCKDIYYANKRNAFIFDIEAMELSELKKELILKCVWFEPKIINGIFDPIKSIRKVEFIGLSDLKFDTDNYKPYYVNADLLFEKYQPTLKVQRKEEEIRIQKSLNKQIKLRDIHLNAYKNFQTLWGFKNESGNEVIPAQYSEVLPFKDGISWVRKTYWGAIDTLGHKVVNFQFRGIRHSIHNDYIIATNKQGKSGILSNDGYIIEPFDYDDIHDFRDGKARVRKNYRWGLIDDKGRPITENKVEIADNIFKGTQFELFGLEDENGNVILPFDYCLFEEIINGKIMVMKDRKYGVINLKGETVIPLEYDLLGKFIDDKVIAKLNNKCGVLNLEGATVIPFEYYSMKINVDGNIIACKKFSEWKGTHFGVINLKGETVIPFEYNSIDKFTGDKYRVNKQCLWGVLNLKGETVIPLGYYSSIEEYNDGKAKAKKGWEWGCIDEKGNELITDTTVLQDGNIKGQIFGKWGIESLDGKNILPYEYDFIDDFIDGTAIAIKNKWNWGVINMEGETIIPFEYEPIAKIIDGIIRARANKNRQWGALNLEGKTIIPFEYNQIEEFIDGRARAMKNTKWGVINTQGETIIPFKYDSIEKFINGKASARKEEEWGCIDEKGNELITDTTVLQDGNIKGQIFGQWGIESLDGKNILPYEYDFIDDFINGTARAIKNKRNWGVINLEGKTIIPFGYYSSIEEFIDGKARALKNGQWGFVSEDGIELFDEVKVELAANTFIGQKFGKYGLEDKNGNELIPFKYDLIAPYKKGIALCYLNGLFKIEYNQAFEPQPYKTIVDGIASFGVFLKIPFLNVKEIPHLESPHLEFLQTKFLQTKFPHLRVIEGKGLLHIKEINKANKRIEEFTKGDHLDLYIINADETKQHISFSINPPFMKVNENKEI